MNNDIPPPTGPPPPPPTGSPLPGPPPTAGLGNNSSLLSVGDWLTDTTRTLVHGFGDFFAVLTVVSLISTALSAPLLWLSSSNAVLVRDGSGTFTSVEGMTTGQGFMVAVGFFVVLTSQLVMFTAATNHIDRVRSGESPRWQETMRAIATRWPRVFGVMVQIIVVAFVILIISGVLGGIGLGVIAAALAVVALLFVWLRSAIAATHAALNGPGGSLGTSLAWTKGLTWQLLGRHVLLLTIALGVLLISSFIATPFQSLSGAVAPAEGDLVLRELIGTSVPAFVAVQFINALASGLVAALWASGMLSLYRGERVEQ